MLNFSGEALLFILEQFYGHGSGVVGTYVPQVEGSHCQGREVRRAAHRENLEPLGYKAFLVGVDREACALYKEAIDKELPPEYSAVVFTGGHSDGEQLKKFHLGDDDEKALRKEFVRADRLPKIFIVTEKRCIAFQYTSHGGYTPDPMLCARGIATCFTHYCYGQDTVSLWVFHRNGDNNTHNLAARAEPVRRTVKLSMANTNKRLSILVLALALCLASIGGGLAVGKSQGSKGKASKGSLSVFKKIQKASERNLIPSNPHIPGVAKFGADPAKARRVDTGENGPEVITYPGRTGACLAVLFDNGHGGTGASYKCESYSDIAKGKLVATLETSTGSRTEYIGMLPDGYRQVKALLDGGAKSHRVVDNVYSFGHPGPRAELVAIGADGSKKALDQP